MIPGSVIGPRNVPSFHKFADEELGGLKKKMCDKKLAKLANPNFRNLANLASYLPKSVVETTITSTALVRYYAGACVAVRKKNGSFFFFLFFFPEQYNV